MRKKITILSRLLLVYLGIAPAICGPGWINSIASAGTTTQTASTAMMVSTAAISYFPEEPFHQVQSLVHSALFTDPYDVNNTLLNLATGVQAAGNTAGTNYAGSAFNLQTFVAAPVNLSSVPGINQQQIDSANAINLTFTGVIGILSNGNGTVGCTGLAYAGLDEQGNPQARLLVMTIEDTASLMFQPLAPVPTVPRNEPSLPIEVLAAAATTALVRPVTANLTVVETCQGECGYCSDTYNQDVQAAEQVYQQAVNDAEQVYNQAVAQAKANLKEQINTCYSNYRTAVEGARLQAALALLVCHTGLISFLTGCAFIGGFFGLFTAGVALALCVIAAHAAYAACTALAIMAYNDQLSTARQILSLCVQTAQNTYQNAVNAAQLAKLQAIAAARDARDAALHAAQAARDACLAACAQAGNECKETTVLEEEDNIAAVVAAVQ